MKDINHAHYWWGSVTDLRASMASVRTAPRLCSETRLFLPPWATNHPVTCELATNPCSSFAFIWKESVYLLRAKSVDLPRTARFLSSLCSPCGFRTVTNRLHAVSSVLCINDKKIFPQPSPTPRSWIESFWVEVILQIFFWGLFFPLLFFLSKFDFTDPKLRPLLSLRNFKQNEIF